MTKNATVLCFLVLFLSSCFALPVEPPLMSLPVVTVPEPVTFNTVVVRKGNVASYAMPSAIIAPTDEVDMFFPFDGLQVAGIYVWVGDTVEAGDIVASLYMPDLEEEIDRLRAQRDRLALNMSHAYEQRQTAVHNAGIRGEPIDDTPFMNTILNIAADLEVVDLKLSFFFDEYASGYLRADVGGTVRLVTQFYEGMLSFTRAEFPLVRISDFAEPVFVVHGQAEALLMNVGDRFDMFLHEVAWPMVVIDPDVPLRDDWAEVLDTRTWAQRATGIPLRDEWGTAAFLMFEVEPPHLLPGSFGRVYMPFGAVFDVVYIESRDLREVAGRFFVYVYEDGLRMTRDVVPGFVGNTTVEIISGLYEGELLIR